MKNLISVSKMNMKDQLNQNVQEIQNVKSLLMKIQYPK